ncbi:MAG: AAA family ATPase, partial [Lachnospiraceae bacterium]|nr:AAA family ATPase [Lachnospiraceae bacterium]
VKKITAFARMKKDLPQNLKVPVALNMEFVGNPGTAKTTVARIMAGLLCEVGLLKSADIVEVGRSDLVAKYVGQTAVKVKEVFSKAEGKLLFIDEAYSLVDFWEGEFGDEAINTIVQEMENRRDKTVVVFAGYPDKMEDFFSRNPGLRSRVPYKITFKDYSVEELVKITELEAGKRGFTISLEASEKLSGIYATVKDDPNSGNGRFCRNVVEAAILNYATRVYGIPDTDAEACNTPKDFTLTNKDFESVSVDLQSKNNKPIGFR